MPTASCRSSTPSSSTLTTPYRMRGTRIRCFTSPVFRLGSGIFSTRAESASPTTATATSIRHFASSDGRLSLLSLRDSSSALLCMVMTGDEHTFSAKRFDDGHFDFLSATHFAISSSVCSVMPVPSIVGAGLILEVISFLLQFQRDPLALFVWHIAPPPHSSPLGSRAGKSDACPFHVLRHHRPSRQTCIPPTSSSSMLSRHRSSRSVRPDWE